MTPGMVGAQVFLPLFLVLSCWISTTEGSSICAGLDYFTATTTSAVFASPDFPSNYGINVYCTWLIEATDSSHTIRLTVGSSSLENPDGSGSCTFDYARAYDGNDMSDTLLGEWCGTSAPILYSTGTYMLIVFRSDWSTVSTGFNASYLSSDSWITPSSKDYTIIIAASSSAFFVMVCIIVFCCIRHRMKKKKRERVAADKQQLPHGEENDVENEKYLSEGGRSLFTQRIVSSRQGRRLQPIEMEPDNSHISQVVAANAASAAVLEEQHLQEKKKEKKAGEKAAKQDQKKKTTENKKKTADEKKKKKGNPKLGLNKKKVGFEETTGDMGTSTAAKPSADSEKAATKGSASNDQNDPDRQTDSPEEDIIPKLLAANGGKAGQVNRAGGKIVLLPTVVKVGSAESTKRQKVEGRWDQVSNIHTSSRPSTAGGPNNVDSKINHPGNPDNVDNADKGQKDGGESNRTVTANSAMSLEKDEGIHLDYEGESGKSSPTSRPSTTTTTAHRDTSVVTPSLVTSIITDTPANGPIPIEAPSSSTTGAAGSACKRPASAFASSSSPAVAEEIVQKVDLAIKWPKDWSYKCPEMSRDILDGPQQTASSTQGTQLPIREPPKPIKDAFLKDVDPTSVFKEATSMRRGHKEKSQKGFNQGHDDVTP